MITRLVWAMVSASIFMAILWVRQRASKNAGIVDVGWAAAVGAVGLLFLAWGEGYAPRRLLAAALIAGWSLRLTIYLYRRVVGEPEDGRYAKLRGEWGEAFDRNLFGFYQFQAVGVLIFALPLLFVGENSTAPLGILETLAVALWLTGVLGVSLSDSQLARYRKRPDSRGKTCREGLWRYSRHPNYFFEWIHWWCYVPLAIGAPQGYLSAITPAALLFFLLFVTGIPVTEAQALASRGDDYREYQRTTSAFIPLPPKKS